jgi:hypothetical protein
LSWEWLWDLGSLAFSMTKTETITSLASTTLTETVTLTHSANSTLSTSFENTNFPWSYDLQVSANYSGSWRLTYQGYNGSQDVGAPNSVHGNQSGKGFYQFSVTIYGIGFVERTLCATAAKLDNSSLPLLVTVGSETNTTNSQTATACETVAP